MNKKRKPSGSQLKKSKDGSSPGITARGRGLLKALGEVKDFLDGKKELTVYHYNIPDPINVREVREKTGLSQASFAARYAISTRTLQQWEQGRSSPDSVGRAYLTVISRNPEAVRKALAGE